MSTAINNIRIQVLSFAYFNGSKFVIMTIFDEKHINIAIRLQFSSVYYGNENKTNNKKCFKRRQGEPTVLYVILSEFISSDVLCSRQLRILFSVLYWLENQHQVFCILIIGNKQLFGEPM